MNSTQVTFVSALDLCPSICYNDSMISPPPPLPPATLAKIEKIAQAGPFKLIWTTRKDLAAKYPQFKDPGGMASPTPCTAEVAADFPADRACFIAVHEYGHLAGKPHSDNPNSVMFRSAETGPLACKLLMPENQPTRSGLRLTLKRDTDSVVVNYIKRCKFSKHMRCKRFTSDYIDGQWYWSMTYSDGVR